MPHIVFSGGGTGGHLFPGLAVAQQLSEDIRRLRITFAGSGKEFERREVAAAGFEYFALPCRPLPRRAREAVSFVVENFAGYFAAGRFLEDENVAAVVGLGGYASVPLGRAARRHRVPLILLEQNVVPGRANRWLARRANMVCTSFAETEEQLRCHCPVRLTGNPIRPGTGGFFAPAYCGGECGSPRKSAPSPLPHRQLLILGGSGGARSLNENVPRALYKIRPAMAGWRIIHQCGEAHVEATRQLYRKLGLEATVTGFLADLPGVLTAADLVVCRAGGTTLAELAAAGIPAVLLPYPHAVDDHQRKNADVFVAAGGAVLVDEREIVGRLDDRLAAVISETVGNAGRRAAMSAAMHRLARPGAAAEVAALIWSVVSSQARHPTRHALATQ